MRLDLIFSVRDIYINSNLNPPTKFTNSSRSIELKDILPWNIPQMITKTIPLSTRISRCEFDGKSMESETTTWSEFCIGGKTIVEQKLASEERNKSKEQDYENHSLGSTRRKVNHLNKVIWDRKIVTKFTRLISSAGIGKPVLKIYVKISKDKNISRWVDQENLIYIRWNRIKNHAQNEEGDR